MTLASQMASFVRAEVARRQVPITAVGTVIASPDDMIPSDRLLVAVDGSALAAPVKRMRYTYLRSGMRVGLQKFGADWVVTGVIVNPVLDGLFGIVKRALRTTNSSTTTSELGVLRLDDVPVLAGRLYKIWTSPLFVVGTVTTDVNGVTLRSNTSGVATTSSNLETQIQHQVANTSHPPIESSIIMPFVSAVDVTLSVLLSVFRGSGGTGNASLQTGGGIFPMHLVVECIGFDPGNTGVVL